MLESACEEALVWEMEQRDMQVVRQARLPIKYKTAWLGAPLKIDLLVEDKVNVECKSVEEYNHVYEAQALTYLRLSSKRLALVINFGARTIKDGVHRVVNGLQPIRYSRDSRSLCLSCLCLSCLFLCVLTAFALQFCCSVALAVAVDD